MPSRLATSALVVLLACGDDEPRVPIATPDEPRSTEAAPPAFTPREGERFVGGTRQIAVEGLALPDVDQTHALLAIDLDGDGDRDALFVRVDAARDVVGVSVALREGGAFRVRASAPLALEGCTLESATLRHPSPSSFVAEAVARCTTAGGPSTGGPSGESRTHRWILSNEEAPRVRLITSTRGETAIDFAFVDLDEDGHEDVRATLRVAERELTLRFLDRPGGLALDRAEPAASVRAAMRESREAGGALARATCRGEDATLRLGPGAWGLDCPEELLAAGRLARDDALLRDGRLVDALLAVDVGGSVSTEALDAVAAPGVTMRRIPYAYRGEPSLDARHVALAFLTTESERTEAEHDESERTEAEHDESEHGGAERGESEPAEVELTAALRVEGASVDRVDRDGATRPADALPPPIRSGDRSPWVVVRAQPRGCGAMLSLARFEGGTLGAPREVALDVACAQEGGALRVLGWAPQGVLAADLERRVVLPLTADGLAAGAPVSLDADAPWPAPARGGRITPDGERWILERAEGVLVFEAGRVALWRPEGWAEGPPPAAAAISADGREIAVLRGDSLWVLTRAE